MSAPVSIAAQGLRRRYRRGEFELVVDRVEVPAGRTLAVLGPSGSGKTTLLHVLGLLERPDAGSVLIDGREASMRDRSTRLQMAAVFQRPHLFKGTVAENVAYGLAVRGVARTKRAPLVADALERVGLAGYQQRSAHELSGGEAQRVSLARALVIEPRVLLLDEPLASLDPLLKRRLTRDFATILRQAGVTVVYVTHDQDEALVVADYIAVMRDGRIVAQGEAESVVSLPHDEWAAGFLGVEASQRGVATRSDDGLVTIEADGATIYATGEAATGTELRFAVRPEDVLLFESGIALPLTTARNRLEVVVESVEPRGATQYATLVTGGIRIAASVSRAAAAELGVVVGESLLAVFKASAVRWCSEDELCVPGTGPTPDGRPATLNDEG